MQIAGFWRRLAAGALDLGLALLLSMSLGAIGTQSKTAAYIFLPPMWLTFVLYSFVLHATLGATIGKLLVQVRVVRLDGQALQWRGSARRSSIDLIASMHWLLLVAPATLALPPEFFHGQGWGELFSSIRETLPPSFEVANLIMSLWFVSEFITMLSNRKRRAIHDFMAGSIVVVAGKRDA